MIMQILPFEQEKVGVGLYRVPVSWPLGHSETNITMNSSAGTVGVQVVPEMESPSMFAGVHVCKSIYELCWTSEAIGSFQITALLRSNLHIS